MFESFKRNTSEDPGLAKSNTDFEPANSRSPPGEELNKETDTNHNIFNIDEYLEYYEIKENTKVSHSKNTQNTMTVNVKNSQKENEYSESNDVVYEEVDESSGTIDQGSDKKASVYDILNQDQYQEMEQRDEFRQPALDVIRETSEK